MSKPTRTSIIIREGRKRAGLTQQELADKLGIKRVQSAIMKTA